VNHAADTSIIVAAVLAGHTAHTASARALAACDVTIAHAAIESYSVLTRLPVPHHVDVTTAATVLASRLPTAYITLDAGAYAQATERLARAGIGGGATYDGLIALTALQHTVELVTRDTRAERTYRALGLAYRLL
jgi:predicted nucleic acid-binding protein